MGALYNQWQVLKRLRFLSQCGRRSGRNGKRKVLPATFELNQVFAVILFPNEWPTGIPRAKAFCRIAPAVRFMAFEILATGVLLLECAFRSRTCSLLQATRFVRALVLFGLVAIDLLPVELAINNT